MPSSLSPSPYIPLSPALISMRGSAGISYITEALWWQTDAHWCHSVNENPTSSHKELETVPATHVSSVLSNNNPVSCCFKSLGALVQDFPTGGPRAILFCPPSFLSKNIFKYKSAPSDFNLGNLFPSSPSHNSHVILYKCKEGLK